MVKGISKEDVQNHSCTSLTGTSYTLRCRKKSLVYAASINKAIYTCEYHPHLIEVVSVHRITATSMKTISIIRRLSCDDHTTSLPPLVCSNKKTVVLDMDKTLIHSVRASGVVDPKKYDFVVKTLPNGEGDIACYVLKRPFVDEFLRFLSESGFEIVVFTAGSEGYASQVLDSLDRDRLISRRLYRDSCTKMDGGHVKNLANLGRDMKKVVIVDDNPISYSLQPENGIPITPFVDDLGDEELKKLMSGFFAKCDEYEDMRDAVKHYLGY